MERRIDHTRRSFLRLRPQQPAVAHAIRPPWTSAESLGACTGCGACVAACPEHILRLDSGGRPEVDFQAGACTFCGDCARSCEVPVFDLAMTPPWPVALAISSQCLPQRGILCESCRDVCLDGAIRFARVAGAAPVPEISAEDCTGCGACVSVCPAGAISAAWVEASAHG